MCNLSKGVEEKGIAKGIEKGMAQGLEKGMAQGITQGVLVSIKNLMETMSWSVEQAMDALKIPEADKKQYMDELSKQ